MKKLMGFEVNFDGIVGLTHNYSGLSFGNIASVNHKQTPSSPKQAALQGLTKMKYLADLGLKQGVLPPQERPHIPTLRALGFSGSDKQILSKVYAQSPELLFACSSASSMWAANAATVSPSSDNFDKLLHLTPANLSSKFHRSIEPSITEAILKSIFFDHKHFVVHAPLIPGCFLTDEGAANHTRFCKDFDTIGVQLFVYGRSESGKNETARFPARQSLEASQALVRLHNIDPNSVIFVQQNPKAVDAGVFHNDVISVGHQNVFFYHSESFVDTKSTIDEIRRKVKEVCGIEMIFIEVDAKEISLAESVSTYLFNSQIVTLPDHSMRLIAPTECEQHDKVRLVIDKIVADKNNPIGSVKFMDLHQSMRNGGGPACLRLRVAMNDKEVKAVNPNVFLNSELFDTLTSWVQRHYRDQLLPSDLADPLLIDEGRIALDELTKILKLGNIYDFQRLR